MLQQSNVPLIRLHVDGLAATSSEKDVKFLTKPTLLNKALELEI